MLNGRPQVMHMVRRTGDVVERVFDPTVPEQLISRDEMRNVSWEREGARIEALLREVPVGSVRAPIVGALLTYLGVETLAPLLRALAKDEGVPPLTQGIAAYLLLHHRVSPQVSAEDVPALAQSLLLGASLLGSVDQVGPVFAHWLTRHGVDGVAVLDRLEPWRIAAIAPEEAVYGPALASGRCAPVHEAIRTRVATIPFAPVRLWSTEQTVWALFGDSDGYRAAVCATPSASATISPLLDPPRADEFTRRLEERSRPATLDDLVEWARDAPADLQTSRVRWLAARAISGGGG